MSRKHMIGLISAAAAVLGWLAVMVSNREPGADRAFAPRVETPVSRSRAARVLFDHGHHNTHSISGRYAPFAKLLEADGCRMRQIDRKIAPEVLQDADVLVIVNAEGVRPNRAAPAFDPEECDVIQEWVRAGGALLLVADHHPCGEAAAGLAARFGVEMSGGWTDDSTQARPGSGDPGQIVFTRAGGSIVDHPITTGGGMSSRVDTVETFTGQSLLGPADAMPLLLLGADAVDRLPIESSVEKKGSKTITTFQTADRSAAGRTQGLALAFGSGRVVVLAEAAMATAQVDEKGRKFGMNSGDNHNRIFILNVMRWLTRCLESEAAISATVPSFER